MTVYEVRQGNSTWLYHDDLPAACAKAATLTEVYPEHRWGPVELLIRQPAAAVTVIDRRRPAAPARAAA